MRLRIRREGDFQPSHLRRSNQRPRVRGERARWQAFAFTPHLPFRGKPRADVLQHTEEQNQAEEWTGSRERPSDGREQRDLLSSIGRKCLVMAGRRGERGNMGVSGVCPWAE